MPVVTQADAARVFANVVLPLTGRGLIRRRKFVETLAQPLGLDRRIVTTLQSLHATYGSPVVVKTPLRTFALPTSVEHANLVLQQTPQPFSPASREKRSALTHFQPHGVLISTGRAREERRSFNESVLEKDLPLHHLAERFAEVVAEEASEASDRNYEWNRHSHYFERAVRRIIFGGAAADDAKLTHAVDTLRSRANFAYLMPKAQRRRDATLQCIDNAIRSAPTQSLAAVITSMELPSDIHPADQIAHWLFAFDATAMAIIRALAMSVVDEDIHSRLKQEFREARNVDTLAFARSCLLESVRLWPTTPAILRDVTRSVRLGDDNLDTGATCAVVATYFHRDDTRIAEANSFVPSLWSSNNATPPGLIPFSAGPAVCPGENLVLLVASSWMRTVLRFDWRLTAPTLLLANDAPYSLSPFKVRLARS